jgi:hypothetical protein
MKAVSPTFGVSGTAHATVELLLMKYRRAQQPRRVEGGMINVEISRGATMREYCISYKRDIKSSRPHQKTFLAVKWCKKALKFAARNTSNGKVKMLIFLLVQPDRHG